MALPTSVNTIYTPAEPVKSNDLNDIQACIVGAKRPSMTRTFFPVPFNSPANWFPNVGVGTYWIANPGVTAGWFSVPVEAGDRVTGLQFNVEGDGVGDCTFNAYAMDANQNGTLLGTIADVNRGAGWAVLSIAPWTNHVFAAGTSLIVQAVPTQGYHLGNGRLIYDRL